MKILLIILITNLCFAGEDKSEQKTISLFGTRPIQINVDMDGVMVQKTPGFICNLSASLGSGKYSEWGQTENDARQIVYNKCSNNSGILLCKKDKIECVEDKN